MCLWQRLLTYLLPLPGKQFLMCMPTLCRSSASIPQQIALACQAAAGAHGHSSQSTDDVSFHPLCGSDAQSDSSGADPALCSTVADGPSSSTSALWQTAPRQGHQQQQLWQPPDGQAGITNVSQSTRKCPLQPLGGCSMSHPRPPSVQLLSLNVDGLRARQ